MLNLKSAYFYFLALKITFIKNLKKVYFKSDYYIRSITSKTPSRFFFQPNPFLLTSFTNNRKFSFKVTDIDPDLFWNEQNSTKETENIHNFIWLNLIDRKNDVTILQKIITVWIYKNSSYKKIIWGNSTVSKRIISWILNSDIILNKTDDIFKNDFFKSIVTQVNHLKKNIKYEKDYSKKIEILTAIMLVGLVFIEYEDNFNFGVKELKKIVDSFFDKNGFPVSRNPNDLVKFLKYLILLKECIRDSQKYVPDYLDEIIDKNLNCLISILTPNHQLPLFNGSTSFHLEEFYNYVLKLGYKFNKPKHNVGDFQIIKNKKNIIYFDVGQAPEKNFSSEYQAGPLSFEYFIDSEKVITNCGFGFNISKKAVLLSRLTSAQSTVSINDTSVIKFERNKLINKVFGNSIKEGFKIFDFFYSDDELEIKSSATHNAYEKLYGCIHKREIKINKKDNIVLGKDEITKKEDDQRTKFNIRFHLTPSIEAVQTMGGKTILIQFKKNKSLVFSSDKENINIEKSIFLGGNKILNNLCINISGNINNGNNVIKWEIKKKM